MEVENTGTENSAENTGSTESTGTETPTEGSEGTSEAGDYTPNFKFKYFSGEKGDVEAEIDDAIKPLIKTAADEKKYRELYEKANGLDYVRDSRDALKQNFSETQQAYETQSTALRTLGTFVQNKDYDSFFEALKIPKNDVLNYALQLVQLEKMDPQQRAQFDAQRQEQQRMMALQMQNSELTQQFQNMAVQGRENELAGTLQNPQISGMISDFDQRAGRPGAFRDLVVQKGQHHFFSSGIDVPVGQVVNEVIQLLGLRPQQGAQSAPQAAASGASKGSAGKPVFPNVQG